MVKNIKEITVQPEGDDLQKKLAFIEEVIGSNEDYVVIIKAGQIESTERQLFGELNIKFHQGSIKQVDTILKRKY